MLRLPCASNQFQERFKPEPYQSVAHLLRELLAESALMDLHHVGGGGGARALGPDPFEQLHHVRNHGHPPNCPVLGTGLGVAQDQDFPFF